MSSKLIAEALDWRYATKQFDNTKHIADDNMAILREAIRKTPTSFGLQPWKVIEVRTAELRAKLREASYNQSQVTDASGLFVFAAKKQITHADVDKFISGVAETRKVDASSLAQYSGVIKGFTDRMQGEQGFQWAQRQAYIGLGFLLKAAAIIQVDATPMEGFDPAKYNEILGLKEYSATVICAVGYRHADDAHQKLAKHRPKVSELFETR